MGSNTKENAQDKSIDYQPLVKPGDIRLLTLLPEIDRDNGQIHCELKKWEVSERPPYRALSYCWGVPKTVPIIVNGIEFQATENLEAALRQIRADDAAPANDYSSSMPIWIDAICVNQADIYERGNQVHQMRTIYSVASEVIVWLGLEDDGSDVAFQMIQSTHRDHMQNFAANRVTKDLMMPTEWHSFDSLFMRPYWRRCWIIQEIAAGKEIRVFCGKDQVKWAEIQHTIEQINARKDVVHGYFQGAASRMSSLLHIRKSHRSYLPVSLMQAIWLTQDFKATNPLDKIYGLLGVTRDGYNLVEQPDYKKTLETLFTELSNRWLMEKIPRDFIAQRDSLHIWKEGIMPSWVPEWNKLGDAPRPWQRMIMYEDKSVTLSDKAWVKTMGFPFNEWPRNSKTSEHKLGPRDSLQVHGHILAIIDGLTSSMKTAITELHNVMKQPKLAKRAVYPYKNIGEALQSCLVLSQPNLVKSSFATDGAFFAGLSTDPGIDRMRVSCPGFKPWYKHNRDFNVGGVTLRALATRDPYKVSRTYISALSEVLLSGMRLFVCQKGRLGMAHTQAQQGDMICYITGSRLPIVLRRVEYGVRVIGEAYLHQYDETAKETTEFNIV